jgi:hypothetical protein
MADAITELGKIIEPLDKVLGVDKELPVARAFRTGGLLGLRVAETCVDDIDHALLSVAFVPEYESPDDDKHHLRHAWSETIVHLGLEAYAKVDNQFDPLFDEWEDQLVPDVRGQRYLRSGFGLPISYLYARDRANQDAQHAAELAEMEAQATILDQGFDWDAEFSKLF